MSERRLPLTILGGFLGSGKTTLVNHLLRNRQGLRVLVMVNDFGSIDVDASLIESGGAAQGVVSLKNGCVCCSMAADLMRALLDAERMAGELDWMIIEASGVSDPGKIAQIGRAGGVFDLESVVTLADAASVREMAADRYVGDMVQKQIAAAHVVLLNKSDLVAADQCAAAHAWLRERAPRATIVTTVGAQVDWELLRGPSAQAAGQQAGATGFLAGDQGGFGRPAADLRSLAIEQVAPYDPHRLRQVLERLGPEVFRVKGVVFMDGAAGPFLLQYAPNRQHALTEIRDGAAGLAGGLVIVGSPRLNEQALRQLFQEAQGQGAAGGDGRPHVMSSH